MTTPTRVLVCDDQVLIRTGLSTIIDTQPDLKVAGQCGDGRAAVDLAAELRPNVVVMDVRMPVLDGIEATRLLAGAGVPHPVRVLVRLPWRDFRTRGEHHRRGAWTGFPVGSVPPGRWRCRRRVKAVGMGRWGRKCLMCCAHSRGVSVLVSHSRS